MPQMPPTPDSRRLRILALAEECNPEWPSLPIVAFKYIRAIANHCDVTVVTQVRNKPNITNACPVAVTGSIQFSFIDTEYVARPFHRFARMLRGGADLAWSTNMAMSYVPYLAFERDAWRKHKQELAAGAFDIVHRVTPMSPALPSYMCGKTKQPFIIGPLNGGLSWPREFTAEKQRERERMRAFRGIYKYLPYARRTQKRAACILASFEHTRSELTRARPDRIVMFPEVGYDDSIFHPSPTAFTPRTSTTDRSPMRFLFVGRLVPLKMVEVAVRAFAGSPTLRRNHFLHIVGDGPDRTRLEELIKDLDASDRIILEGRRSQAEVADFMRKCDVFVFPSIRELGGGVIVEAMACGMLCIVADYGGPGALVGRNRGLRVPIMARDDMVLGFRREMEMSVGSFDAEGQAMRMRAAEFASAKYRWDNKALFTLSIYKSALAGDKSLPGPYSEPA